VTALPALPLTLAEAATLCCVAVLAGAINAIAGGGTLLTFPTLLWFGTASLVANATNTLAMFLGTAGSIFSYRRQIAAIRPWLWRLVPVSALGGWLGGVLLTQTSERMFATLVPFLILFATLVFIGQGAVRRMAGFPEGAPPHPHRRLLWLATAAQFLVAVYGGYFGAGIGILMLASLGFLGLGDLHAMNAAKNILASVINCIAALWFIASGLIDWPRAAVLTAGAVCGYFLGAHYSQRVPQAWVRRAVVLIGLAITLVQFWRQFLSAAR
jgi:uncharacterized membrane protein YfcA